MKHRVGAQRGFTIVELLIVVVVIAILAAITIISYNGITNRANDSSVQADLRNIAQKTEEYRVLHGVLPSFEQLRDSGVSLNHEAYGAHYIPSSGSEHNLLRCQTSSGNYMYVAASKSGRVFRYLNGTVSEGVGPLATHTVTCPNNGLGSTGSWIYVASSWII